MFNTNFNFFLIIALFCLFFIIKSCWIFVYTCRILVLVFLISYGFGTRPTFFLIWIRNSHNFGCCCACDKYNVLPWYKLEKCKNIFIWKITTYPFGRVIPMCQWQSGVDTTLKEDGFHSKSKQKLVFCFFLLFVGSI